MHWLTCPPRRLPASVCRQLARGRACSETHPFNFRQLTDTQCPWTISKSSSHPSLPCPLATPPPPLGLVRPGLAALLLASIISSHHPPPVPLLLTVARRLHPYPVLSTFAHFRLSFVSPASTLSAPLKQPFFRRSLYQATFSRLPRRTSLRPVSPTCQFKLDFLFATYANADLPLSFLLVDDFISHAPFFSLVQTCQLLQRLVLSKQNIKSLGFPAVNNINNFETTTK